MPDGRVTGRKKTKKSLGTFPEGEEEAEQGQLYMREIDSGKGLLLAGDLKAAVAGVAPEHLSA